MIRLMIALALVCSVFVTTTPADMIKLRDAVIAAPKALSAPEHAAVQMLVEEVEKRSGVRWNVETERPEKASMVVSISEATWPGAHGNNPDFGPTQRIGFPTELPREGYGINSHREGSQTTVFVGGKDARGVLFGCGRFLRELRITKGSILFDDRTNIMTSPAYPIRGHQLGYRAQANSWDAWTPEQFEQYISELTFFGVNSIENIPFQDERPTPLMKLPRREMNKRMSEICAKYGLDYWVWTPADFDLKDAAKRDAELAKHEELYRDCPELTGVFFPGGDPGDNPPELVMPFLEDVAKRLAVKHPKARVWLSLQGFKKNEVQFVREYIEKNSPTWLGGLVAGPGSPPIPGLRNWLPSQYGLRDYPDITHNKLCQYPVPWWDPAFALTLGRESINPRPVQYAYIHNWFAPYTNGFISYSDGVHDDVNKTIWSALSWDPTHNVRDILVQYARVFFNAGVADAAADGILALEKNWRGPAAENGAIESTLLAWQGLEKQAPELNPNWRWQMCLLRANYDAYVRRRLLRETALEDEANAVLSTASKDNADTVMARATEVLGRAESEPESPDLRKRVDELCQQLFDSVGLQTSVDKYHASSAERGAVLDFVDYPMNNRWWLEDEFQKIRTMPTEAEKIARLKTIATWEHPAAGSYYDDIGHPGKSPHVLRSEETFTEPGEEAHPEPTLWWWNEGKSRARLSWQSSMDWPLGVVYEGLDPKAAYTIRTTGIGQALLRIDGERVSPTLDGRLLGEFKEFPVDPKFVQDRKITITWDRPTDEAHLNWRQKSHVDEIWLLKK